MNEYATVNDKAVAEWLDPTGALQAAGLLVVTPKPLEWADLWAAMSADPEAWQPTTEAMYWAMLECVPPAAMGNGAFLVGEANNHNDAGEAVYACFMKAAGEYRARYMTRREFSKGETQT